jgi:hypothetical protein
MVLMPPPSARFAGSRVRDREPERSARRQERIERQMARAIEDASGPMSRALANRIGFGRVCAYYGDLGGTCDRCPFLDQLPDDCPHDPSHCHVSCPCNRNGRGESLYEIWLRGQRDLTTVELVV